MPSSSIYDHPKYERNDIDVKHNPFGPWAHVEDPVLKQSIAANAARYHGICRTQNSHLDTFEAFLDAYTDEWLRLREQVEEESRRYGFAPCESTSHLSPEDRRRAALLALTLNGSFLLLGNGCLTPSGGSGRYERSVFRTDVGEKIRNAKAGVMCTSEAELRRALFLGRSPLNIKHTSPLYALYYTTRHLPAEDALRLGNAIAESVADFSETVGMTGDGETVKEYPSDPEYVPQEVPLEMPRQVPQEWEPAVR